MVQREGISGTCAACLFFEAEAEAEDAREHCWRFARFVDHVITDATRNCSYWTSKMGDTSPIFPGDASAS
ncbi:MAG: hypothetical protein AB2L22_10735 [Syntrophales bacterium]